MSSQNWQYKTINLKVSAFATPEKRAEELEEVLNLYGAQGWDLNSIEGDGSGKLFAFFKKPL